MYHKERVIFNIMVINIPDGTDVKLWWRSLDTAHKWIVFWIFYLVMTWFTYGHVIEHRTICIGDYKVAGKCLSESADGGEYVFGSFISVGWPVYWFFYTAVSH